jgi:murein DD-endopeptidase MepM/ murein hydrolase activator NlpD
MTRMISVRIVCAVSAALMLGGTVSITAAAEPAFKLPLACGAEYQGSTYHGHGWAVDFNQPDNADAGDPVLASAAGTVSDATQVAVNGQITINHGGGWETLYAHMSGIRARKDAFVSTGQVIGYVDDAGLATREHLHYEQKLDGKIVQPRFDGVPYRYGTTATSTNCGVRPSELATFYDYGNGAGRNHAWRNTRTSIPGPARGRVVTPI